MYGSRALRGVVAYDVQPGSGIRAGRPSAACRRLGSATSLGRMQRLGQQSRARTAARARLAEVRAAEAQQERRRRRLWRATGAVAAVVVLIIGLIVLKVAGVGESKSPGGTASTLASRTVVDAIGGVPKSVFNTIGAGSVNSVPQPIQAPALTADGKPQILYVGAEYCPYCAAQRWALAVALARFGTWSALGATSSASEDVFPNTPSLSFHNASYTSDYLSFAGYELTSNVRSGNGYEPLDTLPADVSSVVNTHNPQGSIPFLYIGGKYAMTGSSFSPDVLAGRTHEQIALELSDPSSPVAKAINGTANVLTASICQLTDGKPGSVCNTSGVVAAKAKLSNG